MSRSRNLFLLFQQPSHQDISTENCLKSLEEAKSEVSEFREIQPFLHFTKSCRKARDFFNFRTVHYTKGSQMRILCHLRAFCTFWLADIGYRSCRSVVPDSAEIDTNLANSIIYIVLSSMLRYVHRIQKTRKQHVRPEYPAFQQSNSGHQKLFCRYCRGPYYD